MSRTKAGGTAAFSLSLLLASACTTLAPALTSLVAAFAGDLIAAASVNYTPRYATHVESLLISLLNDGTGLAVEGQLARTGYRPPPPDYAANRQDDANSDADGDPYGGYSGDDYYEPYGEYDGDGYDGGYEDPYPDDPYYGGTHDEPDPAEPGDGGDVIPALTTTPESYARFEDIQRANDRFVLRGGSTDTIVLDAMVLVRRAGSNSITSVDDGAVIYDGNGDPAKGDLLRFHARANCDCYLYVIGIDATGFVASIFPDADNDIGNPVAANRDYLFPGGNQWWGLDDQTGVEHVYFVVSAEPRNDILEATRELGNNAREPAKVVERPVRSPAILPTRGLVRVETTPVEINVDGTAVDVAPDRFSRPGDSKSITVTRWFRHE